MYIAPNSTVKLYADIPITKGRQIAFSTKANQTAYFESKKIATYTPTTYCRPNEQLRIDSSVLPFSTAMRINYLSFVNPDFENIIWYARVTSSDYLNNGCVLITFALDLFQTFLNDFSFETCLIDREQLSVTDYDKSVANPYDYEVIELQTTEDLPVPDFCYDFPAITGRNGVTGPKRTHLPGGYEDTSAEKTADNTMMYTLVMSCPISTFTPTEDSSAQKKLKLPFGIDVTLPVDFFESPQSDPSIPSYEGSFPEESMESMFYEAGFFEARRQEGTNDPHTDRDHIPIPTSKAYGSRARNIKALGSNGVIDGIDGAHADYPLTGVSWICWPYSDGNVDESNNACGYDAGFGCYGLKMNNVNTQTLILATSNYNRMCNILNILAENDAVSSVNGCYMLPLSFLTMIHCQAWNDEIKINYTPLFSGNEQPTSAPNVPPDFNTLDGNENQITVFTENVHPLDFTQVQNKKLLTFPYQYIRVTDPSGIKKEYKFEDFPALQNNNSGDETTFNVKFTLLADLVLNPKIEMYPYLYKMDEGTGDTVRMSFRKKLNVEERMEYTDIPQQSYMTDAFTAYCANTYRLEALNNTRNALWSSQTGADGTAGNIGEAAKYNAGKKRGVLGGINELIGNSGGGLGNYTNPVTTGSDFNGEEYVQSFGLSTGATLANSGQALRTGARIGRNVANSFGPSGSANREVTADQMATSAENEIANLRIRQSGLEWANGNYTESPYLAQAKSAFRVNNYHAGTGSGILPYFLGGFKFTFDVMKLKPEFIEKYDNYFTNYGYNSTRVGIPHIETYLHGTKTGNAPKFLQNEDGYYVTYIKTLDCKISHYNKMIASFLEGLFDGGIQLIDGDTLL